MVLRVSSVSLAPAGPLARLHLGDVHRYLFDTDSVAREFLVRAVVELGRLEQRLRRDAAGVEARASEGAGAIAILTFVDAGGLQPVLGRADCGHIPGRSRADDDDVEGSAHRDSPMKCPERVGASDEALKHGRLRRPNGGHRRPSR
jgi:hypothetical protein